MKSTGVLRRIDDLGRIVIPKEIRKNLKIKNGESLEIFINADSIILKKYSLMSDLSEIAQNCGDAYFDVLNKNIIITDRDNVIAASGTLKKKYLNKEISKNISKLIDKRELIIDNVSEIEISTDEIENYKYVISPVISSGDPVGAVIIMSNENITTVEEKSANFISKFLAKHIE